MSWLSSAIPLFRPRAGTQAGAARHPFDVRYRVDTGGLMYAGELPTGRAADRYSEGYYATAPSLFRGAMRCWLGTLPGSGLAVEDYLFVDLGCGKGRVLMLASEWGFQSIRGIELNRGLARIGGRNVRRWVRRNKPVCRDIGVQCGDVLEYGDLRELPDGPVLLFIFNAFGAEVLAPLMEKVSRAARGREAPVDLIYVHPDHDELVARMPGIELLRYAEIPFSDEDAQADVFGVSSDFCSVYRFCGCRAASQMRILTTSAVDS